MRRPFLAAAALGLLAAAALTPLAYAHGGASGHDLSWLDRGDDVALEKIPEGERIVLEQDWVDLGVDLMGDDKVSSWRIEMVHPSGATAFCAGGAFTKSTRLACNWDTTHLGDMTALTPGQKLAGAQPAPNGTYAVRAVVIGQDCGLLIGCRPEEEHILGPFNVTVGNDLVKPAMPVARSENGTIFVEFHRNPEPDAVTMLQERVNGGAWADKGTDTHFQRPGDPGVYEYRAVASRPHSSQMGSDVTPAFEVMAPPPGAAPGDPGTVAPAPGETPTTASPGTTATTRPKSGTSSRPRGTEQSRGLSGSTLFSRPTVRQAPPSTTVTTVDDGFQEAITYPTQPPKVIEMPGEERAVERLITEERPIDVRGMLIPLAGGLAVFVLAMQMIYMARRRPSIATASEDDWA
jgi:hypothetical protein